MSALQQQLNARFREARASVTRHATGRVSATAPLTVVVAGQSYPAVNGTGVTFTVGEFVNVLFVGRSLPIIQKAG